MSTVLFDPKVIQDQARDQLLADPTFANIPVISADPGDIVTQVNVALEKLGIGVLVMAPGLHCSNPGSIPGPYFDKVRLVVEIIETATLNRDPNANPNYITAQTLSMVAAAVLDRFAPAGINERFYVTDVVPLPMPNNNDGSSAFNIWHVELNAGGGIGYKMPKQAPVVATPGAPGTFLLSCATPGASIWFTLDGSYPAPRNPNARLVVMQSVNMLTDSNGALLYDSLGQPQTDGTPAVNFPIAVSTGQKLCARAWLAGYATPTPDQLVLQT